MATSKKMAPRQAAATRTRRGDDPDARGVRGVAEDAERAGDEGLLSVDELEKLIRDEFEHTSLPNPPVIPGYHLCWLTSTSQYDSIAKRTRLGYQPVQSSEVPNFDPSNGQSLGGYEGFVTCNEMVLFKIREDRYKIIMNYFHHKRPLEDEESIIRKVKEATDGNMADSAGKSILEVEGGIKDLERHVKTAPKAGVFS